MFLLPLVCTFSTEYTTIEPTERSPTPKLLLADLPPSGSQPITSCTGAQRERERDREREQATDHNPPRPFTPVLFACLNDLPLWCSLTVDIGPPLYPFAVVQA